MIEPTIDVILAVAVVVLAVGVMLYIWAVRVDRLHRQVLGARATLEAQLVLRAQAAQDVAMCGLLDAASAMLVSRAAHCAMETEGPLVDDGLDPDTREISSYDAHSDAPCTGARARAAAESDLSRVLRTVLDTHTRAEMEEDDEGRAVLARLDRGAYRLVLARSFHNTHVAEARRLRSHPCVRLFHLAGHAPMPATFDMDDLIDPEDGA